MRRMMLTMSALRRVFVASALLCVAGVGSRQLAIGAAGQSATSITTAGQPAQLDIRSAGTNTLRVTLKPLSFKQDFPATPAVAVRSWPPPAISLRTLAGRVERSVGRFRVAVERVPSAVEGPEPLRVTVRDAARRVIQTLRFETDGPLDKLGTGPLSFDVGDGPVLGMGE